MGIKMAGERKILGKEAGDGGGRELTEKDMELIVLEAQRVRSNGSALITKRRTLNERTRWCMWDGQDDDGKKHADALGKPPFPWEGASDGRIRTADTIVNERECVLVAAALMATASMRVKGVQFSDEKRAGNMAILLKWILHNKIGWSTYLNELRKLAQYQEGHSPGGAVMSVWWRQEDGLRLETITLEELLALVGEILGEGLKPEGGNLKAEPEGESGQGSGFGVQGGAEGSYEAGMMMGSGGSGGPALPGEGMGAEAGMMMGSGGSGGPALPGEGESEIPEGMMGSGAPTLPADQVAELTDMISNPEREEEAIQLLLAVIDYLKPARAKKMVRELRETGEATFPRRFRAVNQPEVQACALFEDVFFPINTTKYQRARVLYFPTWYSYAEVQANATEEGWSDEFVKSVLGEGGEGEGFEGESGFDLSDNDQGTAQDGLQGSRRYEGLYEITTVLYRAVNEDGVLGIYRVICSVPAKKAAVERTLLDYAHGEYPGVYFPREALSNRILDSRGVPELVATQQESQKGLHDSYQDHVSVTTVPPLFVPINEGDVEVTWAPLAKIPRRRVDDYALANGGQYPAANDTQRKELRRQIDEYFGRENEDDETSKGRAVVKQQGMVNQFLACLSDVFRQIMALAGQYMEDDEIARVVGKRGQPLARTMEEIRGSYDVIMHFDVNDLDKKYLLELAKVLNEAILPMDTAQTVQRDKLVQRIFTALDPSLADDTLRPVEEADETERQAERNNFAQIYAGIEPPMATDGQNYRARLASIEEILKKNPESVESMTPMSRQILQARVKHLEFQVKQEENKAIGVLGAAPALG